MLALKDAEVEVSFVIQKQVTANAKGKTQWVLAALGAEVEGQYSSDQVHKIRLRLEASRGLNVEIVSAAPLFERGGPIVE